MMGPAGVDVAAHERASGPFAALIRTRGLRVEPGLLGRPR